MALDPRITDRVLETYQQLQNSGDLLSDQRLQEYRSGFRSRFGPEKLKELDGDALLDTMHSLKSDGMLYWLEFKNDEEFPTPVFGSIHGGSALKYGFYQRKETGVWLTGTPRRQTELSPAEAIGLARRNLKQLQAGCQLLEALPSNGTEEDYQHLQLGLAEQAPDLTNTAWGHKYFTLLFPDKLDNYHVEEYQRFHLIKMLQPPPKQSGRYLAAGRYVSLARDLGMSLDHLTLSLNRCNGRPQKVWRIGTRLNANLSLWSRMQEGDCTAIGWGDLGDLSDLRHDQTSKDWLRDRMMEQNYSVAQLASRKAGEVLNFVAGMAEGDLVLASDGKAVLGIGRVSGSYQYDKAFHGGAPHLRPVEWLVLDKWELPVNEGLQTTVFRIRKNSENLLEVERRLLDGSAVSQTDEYASSIPKVTRSLSGIPGRIQTALARKGQVILYGPPGTGKTYWARSTALDLASLNAFGILYQDLDPEQEVVVSGGESQDGLVRACTFHPSYGYEDFLEGYRPQESPEGQLVFRLRDGIFKDLCEVASKQPSRRFYLLIDEINRGDIPRIFGELLTLLEKDKRGQATHLPLSNEKFQVPENVHIIGTMNTADRSIALLDTALRRRFGFIELMPDPGVLSNVVVGGIPLGPWLAALNEAVRNQVGRDARNLQIGHAYLLESGKPVTDFPRFCRILAEDIIPLLEEYCYEDYDALARILGKGLVDDSGQRIREELFSSDRQDELVQALMAPYPEIGTSLQATALDDGEEEIDEIFDDDGEEIDEITDDGEALEGSA